MELIIFLLALPIFFLLFLLKHGRKSKRLLPPGPLGLPIIGNLHQFDSSAPHQYLWKLSKKYGPLMSLRLGFVPVLVVSSPKMAKEVMKTHDLAFATRPSLYAMHKLSYNGLGLIFVPYSDHWRETRKMCVTHLFNSKSVQSFQSIREDEVSLMIEKINQISSESKVVNLSEILVSLTTTIICRTAFGRRYEDEGNERSRFHSLFHDSEAMLVSFFVQDYFPLMGWVDKVNGLRRRLEKVFKEMDSFYQEIIDYHLNPNRPRSKQEDFVDILLRLKNEHLLTIDLSWDHIKALLMDIFSAATGSSAAILTWAMTALMKNPEVMEKVQEEVRNMVGNKGFVHEEDLQNLPYLKSVVKEVMRLHPSAPLLTRETLQSCNINGYEIPAKTLVYVNAWAIGRDPEAWENPEEFSPERFLGNSFDFKGQEFRLVPFGGGRRGCPGIDMAVVTVEVALANLVYSFDWGLPVGIEKKDIDMDVLPGLTMHKKNSLCLVAEKKIYCNFQ